MTANLPLKAYPGIRGGLESVVAPLPLTEDEWRRGVNVRSSFVGELYVSGYGGGSWGAVDEGDEKPVNQPGSDWDFFPVTIGDIFECGALVPQGSPAERDIQFHAEALLEREQYRKLAELLYTGETYVCGDLEDANDDGDVDDPDEGVDFTNPGFIALAELPVGYDDGAPGSIRGVFQGLLDSVCDVWTSDPVFHVARAWMPHFLGDVVKWDEATQTFRFGPHLVSFDCYPNEGPAGTTTAVDGSEVWVYASMQPMVGIGDNVEVQRARNARQNTHQIRAEREAIIAFDATLVAAAKATVA